MRPKLSGDSQMMVRQAMRLRVHVNEGDYNNKGGAMSMRHAL